jgi:hypothetical protein
VSKTDEYTGYALALLEMAENAPSAVQKQRLLSVAEGWLDLADRVQKRRSSPNHYSDEHPLIRAKLGDEYTDA